MPDLPPVAVVAAVLALHALAILCAYYADRARTNLVWSALILSAILAATNGYLMAVLHL